MNSEHRDPFLGAPGHYDGTDVTLILQEGPPKLMVDRQAITEIYGDIFGDEKPQAPAKKPRAPRKRKAAGQ